MSAPSKLPVTKGATVVATLAYVRVVHGEAALAQLLSALEPGLRDRLTSTDATAELPYIELLALWRGPTRVVLAVREGKSAPYAKGSAELLASKLSGGQKSDILVLSNRPKP